MTFDTFCDEAQNDEVRESQKEEDRLGLDHRLRPSIEEAKDNYAHEIDDVGRPRTGHFQIPAVVRARRAKLQRHDGRSARRQRLPLRLTSEFAGLARLAAKGPVE